jgi:hypothetical protein
MNGHAVLRKPHATDAPPAYLNAGAAGVPAVALSTTQLAAIRAVMRTFVDDDLARGVALQARMFCHACQQGRAMAGFIAYDRYQLCNWCATEYEVARARGEVQSAGQFVRDKVFGEGPAYALDEE